MQHGHHLADDRQALWRNLKPGIKRLNQLAAHILARVLVHVVVGTHEDLLILRGPCPILVFRAIHARFVALVFVLRGQVPVDDRLPVSAGWRAARTIRSISRARPRWNWVWWLE